jgi:hypothetical protein
MTDTAPAALTGLISQTQTQLAGVLVHFGPPMTNLSAKERICFGFDPAGAPAVDDTSEWAQLGAQKHEDRYEIAGALVVWAGSPTETALQTAFARAYVLLNGVRHGIAQDYTLGGAVRIAHVASHTTVAEQTDDGPAVTVSFRVACSARTTD